MMRNRYFVIVALLVGIAAAQTANAQQSRLIVRDTLGLKHLSTLCPLLGCKVLNGLGDPSGQLFVVAQTNLLAPVGNLVNLLLFQVGIADVQADQLITLVSPPSSVIPQGLTDPLPMDYYGTLVWNGYLSQPANQIIRTAQTQSKYQVSGAGIVAIIDTGVDPLHPALAPVLLPGYDFTRDQPGADETGDLDHSTVAVLDGGGGNPVVVGPALAAVIPAAGIASLSNPQYAAFGHGTMTAGLVHLVAPTAQLLPLKAFSANGSGYLSNVLQAIYYATDQGSKVISMSFNFNSSSSELSAAIDYAESHSVICVASAGNSGKEMTTYPASLNYVMGVGSTSDSDTQSSFSNYGSQVVWVAAPGENIVSTYPFGTYASSSGTSFSAPLVSGTAALLVEMDNSVNPTAAANAIAHAKYISSNLDHGRLDIYLALGSLAP